MPPKLPHDIESEKALIGSLIISNEYIPFVIGTVTEQDFYDRECGMMFAGICELYEQGKPVDIVSLNTYMTERHNNFGGISIITGMADGVISSLAETYAQTVANKAARRRQYQACYEAAQIALNEAEYSLNEAAAAIETKINQAAKSVPSVEAHDIKDLVKQRFDDYYTNKQTNGVKTGFADIDKIINFMADGQLIIIAARPGMGKTLLASEIALNVSKEKPVLFFTLEMTKERLTDRLLCSIAGINGQRYKNRTLDDTEIVKATNALGVLSERKIKIVDKSVTTNDIRSRCYREKQENGLGLVVIDYLGKINDKRQRGVTKDDHVGQIVNSLQVMGKELQVPVLLLCQLNRNVEYRRPPIPTMADLRDSGNIEQDADIIMFIYREEYYTDNRPGEADILIEKNRDGAPGSCVLTFSKNEPRFRNWSKYKYGEDE